MGDYGREHLVADPVARPRAPGRRGARGGPRPHRGARPGRGRADLQALARARAGPRLPGRPAGAAGRGDRHGGRQPGPARDPRRRPGRGRGRLHRDGRGSYLASEAEEALYAAEIRDEGAEIAEHPEREVAELALVLEHEGLDRAAAERVALGLAANPTVFLRTKVQKELGLSPDAGGAALGDALTVGLSYLAAAFIPLWPYAVLPLMAPALIASLACTLVALFVLGWVKGRVARQPRGRSGLQVLAIGSVSAGVGFAIGHIVTSVVG
ncbi:hypothetical protein FSW04_00505 [Baekduia soli]|uniref:VIT family protein n=1 Tax=Baekduia soli TaxID=496014 RepID=A0A5B8TZN9_9ACTN|nr:hypothetical protein FSW04_00505 [Baekduia soli]